MLDRSEVGKRGYLNEDYRLFHLRDSRALALDYHYHEFDKLVFQLGGRATYNIEGKSYPLQPMDVLLVSRGVIHLPAVDPGEVYERMVLWMDRSFLARFSAPETDLAALAGRRRISPPASPGRLSAGCTSSAPAGRTGGATGTSSAGWRRPARRTPSAQGSLRIPASSS